MFEKARGNSDNERLAIEIIIQESTKNDLFSLQKLWNKPPTHLLGCAPTLVGKEVQIGGTRLDTKIDLFINRLLMVHGTSRMTSHEP